MRFTTKVKPCRFKAESGFWELELGPSLELCSWCFCGRHPPLIANGPIYVKYFKYYQVSENGASPKQDFMSSSTPPRTSASSTSTYSRKNPFLAELTGHDRLTKPGSLKDTRHFVLNLSGSGLTYTPGDSLGAFGRNSPEVVDELISFLEFDPQTPVKDSRGEPTTFRTALLQDYTINRANRKVMGK